MNYRLSVALFFLLQACTPMTPQGNSGNLLTPELRRQFDEAKTKIGHTYWADHINLCDSPAITGHCEWHMYHKAITAHYPYRARPAVPPYGPFEVTNVIALSNQVEFYYVLKGPDGELKYTPSIVANDTTFLPENPSEIRAEKQAKAKASCTQKGGVSIGMSEQEVLASCWGRPQKRNTTITAGGTHEQWVYSGGYLYLDHGVVTGMQKEGR